MQDLESSKSYGGAERYQTQSKHCQGHNGPNTLSVQNLLSSSNRIATA